MFKYLKHIYIETLPITLPICIFPTAILGMGIGITQKKDTSSPLNQFIDIIGFTGIGVITGFTYPISFPLFSTYIIYRHFNK
jgi:hypothetical protein